MGYKPVNRLRKSEWMVDVLSLEQGQRLVRDNHYAKGSSNTAVFRHGLFRKEEWPFNPLGAALWLAGPTPNAARATVRDLGIELDWRKILHLSRLVIAEEVPTNGASFLMAASLKIIKATRKWEYAITYADQRLGHTGAIYRATGWDYLGEIGANTSYVDASGRMIARRVGDRNRTVAEFAAMGAVATEAAPKHKFAMDLR